MAKPKLSNSQKSNKRVNEYYINPYKAGFVTGAICKGLISSSGLRWRMSERWWPFFMLLERTNVSRHSLIRMTEKYAKVLKNRVKDDMIKVLSQSG